MLIQRGTCTPMFIAALSTRAKLWKEPKCASTDEQTKEMYCVRVCVCVCVCVCVYNGILLGDQKWNLVICNNVDGTKCIMLSKISQAEKDKYHMISLTLEFKKHNRWTQEKGRKNKIKREREANHKRPLKRTNWGLMRVGKMGDGHWGHLLRWALDIVCKRWITRIQPQNQQHTAYNVR